MIVNFFKVISGDHRNKTLLVSRNIDTREYNVLLIQV
jgi:hypothetical protein